MHSSHVICTARTDAVIIARNTCGVTFKKSRQYPSINPLIHHRDAKYAEAINCFFLSADSLRSLRLCGEFICLWMDL